MTLNITSAISNAILLSAIFLTGCTFTTTTTKQPVFNEDTNTIQAELNKIVSCENINLNGKEMSTNGKKHSELEIDIINAQNVPSDEDRMTALEKSIGVEIKKSLKDQNEYDTYQVLFITEHASGAVTLKSSKGRTFKSEEL